MGIFSKKSKIDVPEKVEVDFTDYLPVYKNLEESLNRELSIGSTDVKRTSFKSIEAGASYDVYSVGNVVKGVFDNTKHFSLADRLKFVVEIGDEGWHLNELEVLSDDDDLSRYREIADANLINNYVLQEIYRSVAVANAIELDELLNSDEGIDTYTEIIESDKLAKIIRSWDYIDMDVQKFYRFCFEESERTDRLMESIIEQSGTTIENIVLKLVISTEPETDEEKAIQWFADHEANFDQLAAGVDGLLASHVLIALDNALSKSEVVLVDVNEAPSTDALPDFSYVEDEDEENEEESAFEGSVTDLDDSIELDYEESDDEDDTEDELFRWEMEEDSFEKEEDSDVPHFIPTTFIFDSVEDSVNQILENYKTGDPAVDDALRNKVSGHLAKNEFLEEEVAKIEVVLEPMSDEYLLRVSDFNELRMEKTVDNMQDDHLDPHEAQVESLETDPVLVGYREESNELFFVLEETERKRHELNFARKKELYGLLGCLPFDENDPLTVNVQGRIEDKIRGIYHVRGVAFQEQNHTSKASDMEDESSDVEETQSAVEETQYAVDIYAPEGRENNPNTPLYYKLVDLLGYDPIELYKEDMRLKADGINSNLPRETKWDTRLNDSYLALDESEKEKLAVRASGEKPVEAAEPVVEDEVEQVVADDVEGSQEATSDDSEGVDGVTEEAPEEISAEEVVEVEEDEELSETIDELSEDEIVDGSATEEEEVAEIDETVVEIDGETAPVADITVETGDDKPSE